MNRTEVGSVPRATGCFSNAGRCVNYFPLAVRLGDVINGRQIEGLSQVT